MGRSIPSTMQTCTQLAQYVFRKGRNLVQTEILKTRKEGEGEERVDGEGDVRVRW
jgi:hypothetical protein